MAETAPLALDRLAIPVNVAPGGELILKGAVYSTHDGATIDAATTTWPSGAPGGASVDAGGLVDFAAGGLHMTSRDPATHEVHAIATGEAGATCAQAGVASPCLVPRLSKLGHSRLLDRQEMLATLKGGITYEVPVTVVPPLPPSAIPYLLALFAVFMVGLVAVVGTRRRKRYLASAEGQLAALAARVREKAKTADPVLAAPLVPAMEAAIRALSHKRVDAASREGKRVADVLRRVEVRLDGAVHEARAEQEKAVADELVAEMEASLAAAEEVGLTARR
jgi:hypothetical protein